MKIYTVELNISDIGILTDILIESSKRCESETTLLWCLEVIGKIQEPIKGENMRNAGLSSGVI